MTLEVINKIKSDINICINKECSKCSYQRGVRCSKIPLLTLALETIEALSSTTEKAAEAMLKQEDRNQMLFAENQKLEDENQILRNEIEILKAEKTTNKRSLL